ncbi:MAG: NCS2 family permease [Saprospiraceae bacterium]|nr:NCS2 family permease [Saprospiraceae bacterium]
MSILDRHFKLTENGTNVKTEVTAGVTTFLTMSYILFVNPSVLSQTGMDLESVLIATALSAALGTFLIGLLANYPFAQAPGMGLNAFFTFTVVFGLGYTWQQGLAIVFISGILFLILTITGLRAMIIEAIPKNLKYAIAPGIGLFIALIGLNNAGLIQVNQGPIISIIHSTEPLAADTLIEKINNAPSQIIQFGKLSKPPVLLAALSLILLTALMVFKVKGAMIWSVIITTLIGIPLGVTQVPTTYDVSALSLSPTAFQMDFAGLFTPGPGETMLHLCLSVFLVVISFTLVDLLDTLGTLLGTANKGGLLDEDGNLPRMNKALFSDATATTIGAVLGTSSVTTYIESSAGIIEGGRTGLTAVTTGILFLLGILLAPVAGVVPVAATAPILIMVGLLMMDGVRKLDLEDIEKMIPAFLMIILMPFTYSIANGIAFGLLFYVLIEMFRGRGKNIHPVLIVLVVLFVLKYILV